MDTLFVFVIYDKKAVTLYYFEHPLTTSVYVRERGSLRVRRHISHVIVAFPYQTSCISVR